MYKPVRAAETGNSTVWICIFGTVWAYLSTQNQTQVSIRNQIPIQGKLMCHTKRNKAHYKNS